MGSSTHADRFWRVPVRVAGARASSGGKVPGGSGRFGKFHKVPEGSGAQVAGAGSGGFRRVPEGSGRFWKVPEGSGAGSCAQL